MVSIEFNAWCYLPIMFRCLLLHRPIFLFLLFSKKIRIVNCLEGSSDIFGNGRSSVLVLGNLRQSSGIVGSLRRSSEIIRNCRKMAENSLIY